MRHLIALTAAALLAATAPAHAADVSLQGQFTTQKDRVQINFTLASGASASFWTDSWQSGLNFDPQVSLFAADGTLITVNDDSDGTVNATAGYYDAGLALTGLAAGSYHLVLSASPNSPVGSQLSQGFTYDGDAAILLADWNQPSYDINANDQKGGFWRVNLSDVTQAAVVPEPGRVSLMLAGLLGLALLARKRQGTR